MFLPLHITSSQQQNQMMVSWVKQTSQQPTNNYWGLPPQPGGHKQQNAMYYHSFRFNKPATTGSKRAVQLSSQIHYNVMVNATDGNTNTTVKTIDQNKWLSTQGGVLRFDMPQYHNLNMPR